MHDAGTTATQYLSPSVVPERLLVTRHPSTPPPDLLVDDGTALLRTVPPPSHTVVRRERLLHLLSAAARRRVTLVVAPPGYGKTTLLAEWAASNRNRRIGWLSLQPADDDPVRFERMLGTALNLVIDNPIGSSEHHPPGDLPVVIVLDDVDSISHGTLCQRLAANLDAMPALRFVLIARADPLAPGFRIRLSQPVVELRRRDLAFNHWEARELITKLARKQIDDAHVDALLERTDGCVASLQLAALSVKSADDVDGFIESFVADNRYAPDVLSERVLKDKSPDVRRFLLRTSVLDQMTGSLCDFVVGTTDGQAMLERLERESIPLMPLDGRRVWFSVHRLLRVLLRQHLRAEDPTAEQQLLERAAAWHIAHDRVTEALGYLAEAGLWDDLANAIVRRGSSMLSRGHTGVIVQWVGLLPPEVRRANPTILLLEAADRLAGFPTPAVDRILREIRSQMDVMSPANRAAAAALHAVWQHENGALEAAMRSTERFLAEEASVGPPGIDDLLALPGMRDLLVGTAHLVRSTVLTEMGRLGDARQELGEAFDLRVPLVDVQGLGIAAVIAASSGRLRLAERTARRALEVAEEWGFAGHRGLASAFLALAQVARERDDGVEAGRLLDLAAQSTGPLSFVTRSIATERTLLELGLGRFDEAQALIAALKHEEWSIDATAVAARWRGIEAQLAFAFGGAGQASALLDRAPHLEGLEVDKERVRIAVAQGDLAGARHVLERWSDQPEPRARHVRTLWSAAIDCMDDDAAIDLRALSQVVLELEQEGQLALFLDVGHPVICPLLPLYRTAPSPFLRRVLEHPRLAMAEDVHPIKALPTVLTAQETIVLGYLPSWISSGGIAERLGVSLNTIKTHMKHIYRKLDVTDRREAVDAARRLGLL